VHPDIRHMPDSLRRAIRKDSAADRCINCDIPVRESLHGVLVLCNCGGVVGMCRECFARVLDAMERAEGFHL
jgi:hypothetical protein